MKQENRERFRADERAYLDEWPMTEAQKQAVLARDYNAAIAEGGNIYFLAKIFATDGQSFQQAAASMTGMTSDEYAAMMLAGVAPPRVSARSKRGARRWRGSPPASPPVTCRRSAPRSTSASPDDGLLAAALRRLRLVQGVDRRRAARRRRARSTTTTRRRSRWRSCRPSPSAAPSATPSPTRDSGRARCPR